MTKIVEFRPEKTLLNINFEKYQFSPNVIPITYETDLSKSVSHQEPLSVQDSFLEASLFAFHNHLFKNPYDSSCWFIDDDQRVWCLRENGELHHAYTFDFADANRLYNSSFAFASKDVVIVTDGGGNVCFLIGDGEQQETVVITNVDSALLMHARHVEEMRIIVIAMLCIVEENSKKLSRIVLLHYSIGNNEQGQSSLELSRRQELSVHGLVDYIYIDTTGNFLTILCQDLAKFHYDSLKNLEEEKDSNNCQLKIPRYCWSQDEDALTVWLKIPDKYKNLKINVRVTSATLSIKIGDAVLIEGDCQYSLDPEACTWCEEKDTLRLELMKTETGQMWSELIKNDDGGEYLPNESLAAELHSRLAHLCTDKPERGTEQPAIGFNAEQLEECDLDGKQNNLQRVNLQEHITTHLGVLGTHNRVLFTQKLISNQVLCIRQDHDGCVWELIDDSEDLKILHASTFPGFGYVEASKSNKKFCISPPNCHYVAVIEHNRHAFIYEKPEINGRIATQRIVDLGPDAMPIMGATATNEYLILLTRNKLYKLKVKTL